MRPRLLGIVVVSVLTMACSGSADLSGHVSVATKPGDVERGAELEVILLNATDALEGEWKRAVDAFNADRARTLAAAAEAEAAEARARADQASASSARLNALLMRDSIDWQAYDQAARRQSAALEQSLKAERRRREARSQLEGIASRYRREAWDLIKKYKTRLVRTDVSGRFVFKEAAPGRYFLASRARVPGREIYWFIPLELSPRVTHTTDLTVNNAGWPFS
jgi:hypothetical protein